MSENWIELHIQIPAASVDVVCNELAELGCTGVTVEERTLDTFVAPDPDEVPPGDLLIKGYFPCPGHPGNLQRRVRTRLRQLSRIFPDLVPRLPLAFAVRQEDWAENWKQHFTSVRIGPRLVVKPTWETFTAAVGDVVINIDPGMAFGTGTHGTTRLCLEALAARFEESPPARVLDVGTGSGILAIAAAALGAERVVACDIDPEACRTARENALLNGFAALIEITDTPLESLTEEFDLVLANILAEENVRLAPALVSRLSKNGMLVLSGILREKEELVREGFKGFHLIGPVIDRNGEWSSLIFRNPA